MTDETQEEERPMPPNGSRRGKKRIIIPVLLLLVVSVAVAGYWYYFLRGFVATDDATIDCDAVTISSKILGRITTLNADEGDTVQAGQLLVLIDDAGLKAEEAQAQANLDYMQQNVQVAKISLSRARDDFYRDSIQYENHVIAREKFDHTKTAFDLAQAQYAVAGSQVKAARSQLAVIETRLTNTKITSAVPGVVARKWLVRGDIAQPGQPIYTLYDLSDVWVTANFEETKLASIHPGDLVEISVDAFPGHKLSGTVALIGAAAASQFALIPPNNASGNFTKVTQRVPVKIVFTDPDTAHSPSRLTLLPGMSVEVRVKVTER
jgi:membrane fusion protein (multidrug efflux system)